MSQLSHQGLPKKPRNLAWLWLTLLALAVGGVIWRLDLQNFDVKEAGSGLAEYFSKFLHPDFRAWKDYLAATGQTLAIAVWGTALAFLGALLLCPLGAKQTTPSNLVYRVAREMFSALRAIPDVIFATLFMLALSAGPQVGVLALALHGIGFLGKTYAENMERADPKIFEAMASIGASKPQMVLFGAYPAIARDIVDYGLYTFDRNVRMATVLGIVGAGGIGVKLYDSINGFRPNETAAIMLIILGTVLFIEMLADNLRKRLA